MSKDKKAIEIAKLRKRQARLIKFMGHWTKELSEIDDELCALLTDCIPDAGLSPDAAAKANEPK